MRLFAVLALLVVLSGCAHPARARYQPQMLAAEARQARAQGRLADAQILLTRAALLAPHDEDIALELMRVRAALAGTPEPSAPPPPAAAAPMPAPSEAAPLPAPWPVPARGR